VTTLAASRSEGSGALALVLRARAVVLERQGQLFVIAVTLVLAHALDAVFVEPGRGVAVGERWLGFVVSSGATLLAAAAYRVLPAALRVAIALVFALLSLLAGYLRTFCTSRGRGPSAATTQASCCSRRERCFWSWRRLFWSGRRTRRRRYAVGGQAPFSPCLRCCPYVVTPVGVALWQTQKPRQRVDATALKVPHQEVTLHTSDGLALAGWYVPSHNRAAVLVVHGGGGSREGVAAHAAMLARHGYGVLLYDARGRGESEGRADGYGWTWGKDVAAALAYLERRPDARVIA
jgi:hypothetical protein